MLGVSVWEVFLIMLTL